MSTISPTLQSKLVRSRSRSGQVKVRSGQGARMDGSDLTMIQVDLIEMDATPLTAVP